MSVLLHCAADNSMVTGFDHVYPIEDHLVCVDGGGDADAAVREAQEICRIGAVEQQGRIVAPGLFRPATKDEVAAYRKAHPAPKG